MNVFPSFTAVTRQMISGQAIPLGLRLLLLIFLIGGSRQAQAQPATESSTENLLELLAKRTDKTDSFRVDVETDLLRKLNATRQLVEEKRPLEAATALQAILNHPADFFVPGETGLTNTRQLLHRWVEQLPQDVLEAYETQSGAQANHLLKEFQTQQNPALLQQASRQYLHTRAGSQAAFQLASDHLDRGEYLACLLQLERLAELPRLAKRFQPTLTLQRAICWTRLGQPEQASHLLEDYVQTAKITTFSLGGQEYRPQELSQRLQESPESLSRLLLSRANPDTQNDWSMFRKTSQRWRESTAFNPLPQQLWQVNVRQQLLPDQLPRPEMIDQLIDSLSQLIQREEFTVLPAWNPILVGERIFVSGFGALAAFSREDGKLLWKSATDDRVLEYLQNEDLIERYAIYGSGEIAELHQYLLQEMIGNLTTGTLSSDGKQVYAIRGCGLVDSLHNGRLLQNTVSTLLVPTGTNLLSAFDAATGRLLWELGGIQGRVMGEFAGHYFLGPPLWVNEQLLLLSENGDKVFFSEIDPASGKPRWIQPLVHPQYSILYDNPRRLAGTAPVYAAPLLICLTNAGTAVAYDLEQQELRWVFSYQKDLPLDQPDLMFRQQRLPNRQVSQEVNLLRGFRWQESVPLVIGARVVMTPVDSQDLYCCDLLTGQLEWTEPRQDGLYTEAVSADVLLIVGRHKLRAIEVKTGRELWQTRLAGAIPAGRGVVQGNSYHLPTRTSGLLTFDLKTGHLMAGTDSAATASLGNVIVSQDQLFSLGEGKLTAYLPLSKLSEQLQAGLNADPQSAEVLALQGQLALHQGDLLRGISLLQESYRKHQSPEIARQLTKTLLSADISRIQWTPAEAEEMAQMMVAADHSTEIIFRYVLALQRLQKPMEAFQTLRRIIASPRHRQQMVAVSETRRVRADALAAGVLQELLEQASPAQKSELEQAAIHTLQQLEQPVEITAQLAFFAGETLQEQARLQYVRAKSPEVSLLLQERHLRWLSRHGSAEIQPEIIARLAQLYASQKKGEFLQPYLQLLATQYAEQECLPGQQGRALAAELRQTEPQTQHSTAATEVSGDYALTVLPDQITGSRGEQPRLIQTQHPADSPWQRWQFELLKVDQQLTAYNAQHQQQWRAVLEDGIQGTGECALQSEGHLAVLCTDGRLTGLDTLSTANSAQPLSARWQARLGETSSSQQLGFGFAESEADQIFGPIPLMLSWERETGQLAGCIDHHLVYRDEHRVIVRDAHDGSLLWEYELPRSQQPLIWADEKHVFLLNLETQTGQRLRLTDGKPVSDTFDLPAHDRLWGLTDRFAIFWQRLNLESGLLFAYDLVTGQKSWHLEVSGMITLAPAGNDQFFLFDAARSQLQLLNPRLQEPVVQQFETPETSARQLFVLSDEHHWFVHFTAKPEAITQPLAFYSLQDINGPMLAIKKTTGQLLWSRTLQMLRWIPQQPEALPFLVYGASVPVVVKDENGEQQVSYQPLLEVIDKSTGETLSQMPQGIGGRLMNIQSDFSKRLHTLNFTSGSLQIEQLTSPAE